MTIMFDAIALAAGVAATPDHRPAHRVAAKTRRAGPVRRLFRDVLSDIGGAVPLHTFEGLRRWQRRRNTVTELTALDDHMLRDIGVSRGSIREVVDAQLRSQAGVGRS
ncbi:MAG: DUF1127 domain-containing protein [Alphaproteobacteria bacterium]